jgi:hypothetical protein
MATEYEPLISKCLRELNTYSTMAGRSTPFSSSRGRASRMIENLRRRLEGRGVQLLRDYPEYYELLAKFAQQNVRAEDACAGKS